MLQKIKLWWIHRKLNRLVDNSQPITPITYTREQVEEIAKEYGHVRYNDGKRDGLAIAREQATNSLKEILWQQNQSK